VITVDCFIGETRSGRKRLMARPAADAWQRPDTIRRAAAAEAVDAPSRLGSDQCQHAAHLCSSPSPVADSSKPREFFIHGITSSGRPFRPSDWADRLCGVMSGYRPGGVDAGRDARIGYSPLVRPMLVGGVRCVVVDERLNELEPMAFSFVMNFARDNDLPVYEGCTIPDAGD
jgi:hypothetical protein